mmetsp:Transcript_61858/g.182644  ORF Transcript_61858/g.182644 Transcript_61858/m.182644 type:complete len:150 (+) Transcript_61858:1054-1503(+)
MSSSCVPISRTFPSATYAILSAFRIVERRCAMTIVVRPRSSISLSRASCTTRSLSVSSALVASSRSRIRGFFTRARAMAMRCFCPPDICVPLSPTSVSYPSGNDMMKSWALAILAASRICSSDAPGKPYAMFRAIVALNSVGSCCTNPI